MKKRIWMMIFALAMVMTCVSVTAAASGAEAVASVTTTEGVTEYTTLAEAIAAASAAEGAELTLLRDLSLPNMITVAEGRFTVDLNGHLWEGASIPFRLEGTADVTVTDRVGGGTIRCAEGYYPAIVLIDSAKLDVAGGTLDGGQVNAVDSSNFSSLTEAELTISGGRLLAGRNTPIRAYGKLLRITGGTFEGQIEYANGVLDLSAYDDPDGIEIYVEASVSEPEVTLPEGYFLYEQSYHTVVQTVLTDMDYIVGTMPTDTAVASVKIGESVISYDDLQPALAAASFAQEGEVTLLCDVTTDQHQYLYGNGRVTLDLNGKTWTANDKALYLDDENDLTIVDRSAEGDGRIVCNNGVMISMMDHAKLELAGGTLEHTQSGIVIATTISAQMQEDTELIISGGTVISDYRGAVSVGCRSAVIRGDAMQGGMEYCSGLLTLTGDVTDVEIWFYDGTDLTDPANVVELPEGYVYYREDALLPCQPQAGGVYRIGKQINTDELPLFILFDQESEAYDAASNTYTVGRTGLLSISAVGDDETVDGTQLLLMLVNSESELFCFGNGEAVEGGANFRIEAKNLSNALDQMGGMGKAQDVVALAVVDGFPEQMRLLALLELNIVEGEDAKAVVSVTAEDESVRYFETIEDAVSYASEHEGMVLTLLEDLWECAVGVAEQGTFTVDLNGYVWHGKGAILSLSGTAQVTFTDSVGYGQIATPKNSPALITLAGDAKLVLGDEMISGVIVLDGGTLDLTERADPSRLRVSFQTAAAIDGLLLPEGYGLYDSYHYPVEEPTVSEVYFLFSETASLPVIERVTFDTDSPLYDADTNTFTAGNDPPLVFHVYGKNLKFGGAYYGIFTQNPDGYRSRMGSYILSDTEKLVPVSRSFLEDFLAYLEEQSTEEAVTSLEIISSITGQTLASVPLRMVPSTEDTVSVTAGGVTTYFGSFADALDDAVKKEGAVVKPLQDLSWIEYQRVSSGTLTLDLNGKSLEGEMLLESGADLLIIDSATGGKLNYGDNAVVYVDTDARLEIGGGTVSSVKTYGDGVILVSGGHVGYIYNDYHTTITGGTVDSIRSHSTLVMTGGTLGALVYHNGIVDLSGHSDPTGIEITNMLGSAITVGSQIKLPDGYGFYDMSNHPLTALNGGEKARIYHTASAPAPKNPVIDGVYLNTDSPAYDAATKTFAISRSRPLIVTVKGKDLTGFGESIYVGFYNADSYYLDMAFEINSDTEVTAALTYDFLVQVKNRLSVADVSEVIKGITVKTEVASLPASYPIHVIKRDPVEITPVFGGTVTVSDPLAKAGDTVTVTLENEECYLPGTFTVTDEDGNSVPVAGNRFVMPQTSVTIEVTFTANHTETISEGVYTCCGEFDPAAIQDGVYQIGTPEMLASFAKLVNAGHTELDAVLTADIDLSSLGNVMIGAEANPYRGSFDGRGKRVSVNMTSDEEYTALFRFVEDVQIENLTVDGTITTSAKFAAGLIGHSVGNVTVKKVISDVAILSSVTGDGTHGGLVANNANGTLTILSSAFVGKIVGSETNACGGMIGWTYDLALSILEDCFVAADFETDTEGCDTFGRNSGKVILDNCYYVTAYGATSSYGVQVTEAQLFSGEVTFLLNSGKTDGTQHWYQSCGEGLPTHSGSTVYYGYLSCAESAVAVYTNDPSAASEQPAHIHAEDDGNCTTDIHCTVCGDVVEEGRASHTGGRATCKTKAKCSICGTRYGKLAKHTPAADDGDCTTDILCTVCDKVITEGADAHTGGTATCKSLAQCALCGKEYGELLAHTPATDDGDCTTDILCTVCGEVTAKGTDAHTGGTATCKDKAKCAFCGKEYGELLAHTPATDDGDCTTDILCTVCGEVTAKGADAHTGGKATCKDKAKCALCGKEYGELASHSDADGNDACDACRIPMGTAPATSSTAPTPTTPSETTGVETDPVTSDDEKDGDDKSGTAPALIITVSVIALAAGGGFGAYWFVIRKRSGK